MMRGRRTERFVKVVYYEKNECEEGDEETSGKGMMIQVRVMATDWYTTIRIT